MFLIIASDKKRIHLRLKCYQWWEVSNVARERMEKTSHSVTVALQQ
jgi:hypothetical protein